MKSYKAVICDSCFHYVRETTPKLLSVWLSYCDRYYISGVFAVHNFEYFTLQCLEAEDLIISTDTDICFAVKVKGMKYENGKTFFCPRNCEC